MSKSTENNFNVDGFLNMFSPLREQVVELKEENDKLKTKIKKFHKTEEKLEAQEEELRAEIAALRKVVKDLSVESGGGNHFLEEKCRRYEMENTKLTMELANETASKNLKEIELKKLKNKYKLVDENILEMLESLEDLKNINNQAMNKAERLAKQVEENNFNYEEELKKYVSEYDKYKDELKKQGISVQERNFPKLVKEFKKLRNEYEIKREKTFKIAYKIDKTCKNKSEETQKYILRNTKEIKALIEEESKRMADLRNVSFINDFHLHKIRFQEIARAANEETAFFKNLLEISSGASASTSKTPYMARSKNTKMLNNNLNRHSTKMRKSKSFTSLINQDLSESKSGSSIIMYNFPESSSAKNDLLEVEFFLMKHLNVKDVDGITISRLGDQKENQTRPVVVTLSNQKYFNDVLKQGSRQYSYRGANVHIQQYDKTELV